MRRSGIFAAACSQASRLLLLSSRSGAVLNWALGRAFRFRVTGIFTVLVDGDDHNEPIADAVRGILDGHVVMQRSIAERGRFPAINILKSVSRTMPRSANPDYLPVIMRGRQVMATYADMEELIRLGAYRAGSSPEVDEAIKLHEPLEAFLRQAKDEKSSLNDGYGQLAHILGNLETER